MARFQREKNRKFGALLLSAVLFLGVFALFSGGVSVFSRQTRARQRQALEDALYRSILTCYALEGHYPQSLDYIRENYHLTYNEELFFVDYRVLGENILPDVTILERGG